MSYKDRLDTLSRDLQQKKGRASLLQEEVNRLSIQLSGIDRDLSIEQETLKLLQMSSLATWNSTKTLIEDLVTKALKSVFFDRDYSFKLTMEIKRNASSVSFSVVENGMELDLVDEIGGGITDVVALTLRLAFIILYRPNLRPFLVLDEPCKHVAANYQPTLGRFLNQLCKDIGLTLLMTTHSKEIVPEANQVFKAEIMNGISFVEEETTHGS